MYPALQGSLTLRRRFPLDQNPFNASAGGALAPAYPANTRRSLGASLPSSRLQTRTSSGFSGRPIQSPHHPNLRARDCKCPVGLCLLFNPRNRTGQRTVVTPTTLFHFGAVSIPQQGRYARKFAPVAESAEAPAPQRLRALLRTPTAKRKSVVGSVWCQNIF